MESGLQQRAGMGRKGECLVALTLSEKDTRSVCPWSEPCT